MGDNFRMALESGLRKSPYTVGYSRTAANLSKQAART